jgi:hypothetical protein
MVCEALPQKEKQYQRVRQLIGVFGCIPECCSSSPERASVPSARGSKPGLSVLDGASPNASLSDPSAWDRKTSEKPLETFTKTTRDHQTFSLTSADHVNERRLF